MASSTKTKYIDFKNIPMRGESAITVIKLMMASNDLSLANEALNEWKKEKPKILKDRQISAKMYFVRLQIAHLYEALKIIESIQNTPVLIALLKKCNARTQEAFKNLENYLHGGSRRNEINNLVGRVRQNITFHYDETGKLIERALRYRASKPETQISSLTLGNIAYLENFKIADDIINSIIVRQIWNINDKTDSQAEAGKVADKLHQIFLWFMDFSREFIWKYFGN